MCRIKVHDIASFAIEVCAVGTIIISTVIILYPSLQIYIHSILPLPKPCHPR